MESTRTHTCTHIQFSLEHTFVMCAADTTCLNTQILSHLSTLHISMFVCCLFRPAHFSSSCVVFLFCSSFTTGCRSSIRSRCLLLSSRNRKQRRDGRTEEEGGLGGGRGGLGWAKQGKKEKPKREKTKNIASGCWVTLESVQIVTLLVVVVMAAGWTQTWGKPCFSHLGWAAMSETYPDKEKVNYFGKGIPFLTLRMMWEE